MDTNELPTGIEETDQTAASETPAWEEIAPGRFMPRRVRGSCHGRVLG